MPAVMVVYPQMGVLIAGIISVTIAKAGNALLLIRAAVAGGLKTPLPERTSEGRGSAAAGLENVGETGLPPLPVLKTPWRQIHVESLKSWNLLNGVAELSRTNRTPFPHTIGGIS
ncbi:hypothetical protein MLD38_037149 [Melastoma candidum]|uniref:Uncharacterized protein n=2 Tax=Melastoma candidum TaxID=119954 RepID=A0ACB9LMF0_9MYRT|nr:hypothetical protein MLD38_037140 [Melastoma candidum]KAI4312329.1 hypothetical protein MLD38_037149 [Melastoma candidum]